MTRSGTGGPCNHCGRTQSPCWRKGPADKPLLCNACGSRYLVKRDLLGYMPIGMSLEGPSSPNSPTSKPRSKDFTLNSGAESGCKRKRESPRTETADNFDDSWDRAVRLSHSRTDSSKSSISGYAPPIKADDASPTQDSIRACRHKPAEVSMIKVTLSSSSDGSHCVLIRHIPLDDGSIATISRRPRKQLKPTACAVL